jgi:hypothetical protein
VVFRLFSRQVGSRHFLTPRRSVTLRLFFAISSANPKRGDDGGGVTVNEALPQIQQQLTYQAARTNMSEPKKDEKKDKKEKEDEPHMNWLVVDHSLRPNGFHMEQQFGATKK